MGWVGKSLALFALFYLAIGVVRGLEPLPISNPFLLCTSGLTAMSDDPSTTLLNPAAGLSGVSSSTSYLYGMDALSQCEISSILEYQDSGVFIGWQTLNNDDYTKQDYRLGYRYGYKFWKLGIGYKLSYDKIPGYGSEKDDCLYAGLRLKLHQSTFDIASEQIKVNREISEPDRQSINMSISQELSKESALAFGISTSNNKRTEYRIGCRFAATKNLEGVVSWESEPGRFGMGSVFSLGWLKLIYAVQTHPELKWTHAIGLSIMFP